MSLQHETIASPEVYGPGTFTDKNVLSVPDDSRRIFEYLASKTPGFTKDPKVWDTVKFEGGPDPMVPGPVKAHVVAAALHAMCGVVANELLDLRDGNAMDYRSVVVNTDHASLWLACVLLVYVNGTDLSTLARTGQLPKIFEPDFERGWNADPLSLRTTALYPTKDPKVWYQLHGSLDATPVLQSMGIDRDLNLDSASKAYDYIRQHVEQWDPEELEAHNVKHGLCGNICYSPEGWRKSPMGEALARHPLINITHQPHANSTPLSSLPKLSDKRPLAGIKVLEMVRIIAGPTIGATLASFGADVIRVNCSGLRDLNVLQLALNAGKRAIDLDLTKKDDLNRLQELVEGADVFIDGFRAGSLAAKGLGLDRLLEMATKRNKGIVYVDENCYGPDGPFTKRPGWQQIGDAASGYSYVMGRSYGLEEGKSILPPLPISDMTTGVVGALGVLMAIRDRAQCGGSYLVVSSLVAADTIAFEPEIGLYPIDVVRKVTEKFQWEPTTPDQYVSEIMIQVIDGWKRAVPELVARNSPFISTFDDTPWGRLDMLKPVPRLNDDNATPRWTTGPVPYCYHDQDIQWEVAS